LAQSALYWLTVASTAAGSRPILRASSARVSAFSTSPCAISALLSSLQSSPSTMFQVKALVTRQLASRVASSKIMCTGCALMCGVSTQWPWIFSL
jgi:hypothetical protein